MPEDPVALARWLIGKRLIRKSGAVEMSGRIVETEAYLTNDPASHSFKGPTARNRSMFGTRGHAYIYRTYGMWFCLNVSAGQPGEGAAVLIRAMAPLSGLEHMAERRRGADATHLMRGPGRMCAALDIDLRLDGLDLCQSNGVLWLTEGEGSAAIGSSPRIGITKAMDETLRFYERGNVHVSGPARLRG